MGAGQNGQKRKGVADRREPRKTDIETMTGGGTESMGLALKIWM